MKSSLSRRSLRSCSYLLTQRRPPNITSISTSIESLYSMIDTLYLASASLASSTISTSTRSMTRPLELPIMPTVRSPSACQRRLWFRSALNTTLLICWAILVDSLRYCILASRSSAASSHTTSFSFPRSWHSSKCRQVPLQGKQTSLQQHPRLLRKIYLLKRQEYPLKRPCPGLKLCKSRSAKNCYTFLLADWVAKPILKPSSLDKKG